ncbi:MAG: hypothetical protein HQL68_08135, partial [Magnetococcales bacterium]|nr:hypothetical protein [Magnetococcales bacterium]
MINIKSKSQRSIFALFLVVGAFSQIAQAILIRELLVVFHGNEISIGAFYGSWLFWIALGGWFAMLLDQRYALKHPLFWVRGIVVVLPLLLFLQMVLVRFIRDFVSVPASQLIPLDHLLITAFLITLPVGLAIGALFPLACKGVDAKKSAPVTSLYILEALGALTGALLFTFLFIEQLGTWRSFALLATTLAAIVYLLPATKGEKDFKTVLLAGTTLAFGLIVLLTPVGGMLEKGMEKVRFGVLHPSMNLLKTIETRYGHVAVASLEEQKSIIENGRISATFPDPHNVALAGAYFYAQGEKPKNILMFGGIYAGLATELLKYPISQLVTVVEDQAAFKMIKPQLPEQFQTSLADKRLLVKFADGRDYINNLTQKNLHDLVLILVSDPSSAGHNRFFTREFYSKLISHMQPKGVLCTRISGASNYMGREVKSYSGSVFHTLLAVFTHVVVMPGDNLTFCASSAKNVVTADPNLLMNRYLSSPPKTEELLPQSAFMTLLEKNRVDFVNNRLKQEKGVINTDTTPVTFFLNMVLMGKYTSAAIGEFLTLLHRMGPWPYLVPPAIFLILHLFAALAKRDSPQDKMLWQVRSALFALTILGFAAMALQILLLFAFQTRVGLIYSRIAVLNGLFMTGIALGAVLVLQAEKYKKWTVGFLVFNLSLVAVFSLFLPTILTSFPTMSGDRVELIFYALSFLVGLLAGGAFPLAVTLTHGLDNNSLKTSGLTEAGDHLGGALGGVLTGGLLVPILGIEVSAQLVAVTVLMTIPPLFLLGYAPFNFSFFQFRNRASFPSYVLVGWLWFLLLSLGLWGWMVRDSAPGPQVQFATEVLTEVSGSSRFTFHQEPFPAYIGTDKALQKQTLSLASIPVAQNI